MNAVQNMSMGAALSICLLAVLHKIDPAWTFNDQQAVAFGVVCGGLWHGLTCLIDRRWPPRALNEPRPTQPATPEGGKP